MLKQNQIKGKDKKKIFLSFYVYLYKMKVDGL